MLSILKSKQHGYKTGNLLQTSASSLVLVLLVSVVAYIDFNLNIQPQYSTAPLWLPYPGSVNSDSARKWGYDVKKT